MSWQWWKVSGINRVMVNGQCSSLVAGMQFIQKVFDTPMWTSLDAKLVNTHFPGCEKYKFKSAHYYECLATHFTVSIGNAGRHSYNPLYE